ncbi:hypothetical protein HYS48_04760 [Candidatus Woesearchaeota archaeon]|nr:hypothetical protein [Candidatus Woesearchaeota archaeon]
MTTPQPERIESLESVTKELLEKGIQNPTELDRRIHAAALLALVSASQGVVNEYVVPTPLFRLEYDPQTHNLQFQELHGRAPVPKEHAVDVSMLDLITAALLREKVSLLFEGITGTGKTHTTEMLFKTILPPENYSVIRLSAAMTNVQQPFIEGVIDNGVLRVNLRQEALDRIAALFVDEQNRGDTNQILQLKDGKIALASGESGYLGLPVPRLERGADTQHWHLDYEEKKPLFVTAAQNPAATKQAQYSATRRTDAAVKNRDLEIAVPNAVGTIGASLMRVKQGNGQHREFLERFTGQLRRYLDVEPLDAEAVKKDIARWFALATDPKRTYQHDIRSAAELSDVLALMFTQDLETEFLHDQATANAWNEALRPYGIDFSYTSSLDATSQTMERIRKVISSFDEQEVPRDVIKVKRLADALAITRKIKNALHNPNHLESYLQAPSYITVEDIAASFAIVAKDKQQTAKEDPVTVVDQVLRDYIGIVEDFAAQLGYKRAANGKSEFDANDPWYSLYGLALSRAIHATKKATGTGKTPITESLIKDLGASIAVLRRLEGGSESKKPIVARMIGDLTTLAGFTHQYAEEIERLFAKEEGAKERLQGLQGWYIRKRQDPATPNIYHQRLPRVLGV